MDKNLSYYNHCFTHLKRDMKNGGAPHKPILLLSVIRLFEKGMFTNNQIYVLPELVASFKLLRIYVCFFKRKS
jgi:putative restriction endonuclease